MKTTIDKETGLYRGQATVVEPWSSDTPSGRSGFAVMWQHREAIGVFFSKDVANGIAATFDALTSEGSGADEPPYEALMELIGFRQILSEVVGREAQRLAENEAATRAAAIRLRGRRWP